MLSRLMAAGAAVLFSAGIAQAGTFTAGAWSPNCTDPGEAPSFSSKSPEAYNASAKLVTAFQEKEKAYADCVSTDAKADQEAVVTGANGAIGKIQKTMDALNEQSKDAVDKLKKKAGAAQH